MPDSHKTQMNHLYTSPMKCLEKAFEAWELAQGAVMDLPADAPSVVRIEALKQLEMAHHAVAEQAKKCSNVGCPGLMAYLGHHHPPMILIHK